MSGKVGERMGRWGKHWKGQGDSGKVGERVGRSGRRFREKSATLPEKQQYCQGSDDVMYHSVLTFPTSFKAT